MKHGTFQLVLFIDQMIGTRLEKATFYTVSLHIGSKSIELQQKKCLTEQNIISFCQSITMRVSSEELSTSKNQARISVYSVQKYGKKTLYGSVDFLIVMTNQKVMSLELQDCEVNNSSIKFTYGLYKIESRASSLNKSGSTSKAAPNKVKNFEELFVESFRSQDISDPIHSSPQAKSIQIEPKEPIVNPFSLKKSNPSFEEKAGCAAIKSNLQLVQDFSKALKMVNNRESRDMFASECNYSNVGSKCKMLDNIYAVGNTLGQVYQKQQNLKNEKYIQQLILKDNTKKNVLPIKKPDSLNSTNQMENLLHSQMTIVKKTVNICIHMIQRRSSTLQVAKEEKRVCFEPQIITESSKIHQNMTLEDRVLMKQKTNKLALNKFKSHFSSIQQLQNDDNLKNIVHEMISEVKGNLGYIKLAKLTKLRKRISETSQRNKFLVSANDQLIKNEEFLRKKLQISEEIIKQKQTILAKQLQSLRRQFEAVTKKLLDKYSEEINREEKVKNAQKKIQEYEVQVKNLQNQVEENTKYIRHLRQLLVVSQQEQKTEKKVIKKEESYLSRNQLDIKTEKQIQERKEILELRQPKEQKEQKFKRTSSNHLFNHTKSHSKESKKSEKLIPFLLENENEKKSEINLKNRTSIESTKGINPNFIDFFTSFRSTEGGKKAMETPIKGPLKRRIYHKSEAPICESELKQKEASSLFAQI